MTKKLRFSARSQSLSPRNLSSGARAKCPACSCGSTAECAGWLGRTGGGAEAWHSQRSLWEAAMCERAWDAASGQKVTPVLQDFQRPQERPHPPKCVVHFSQITGPGHFCSGVCGLQVTGMDGRQRREGTPVLQTPGGIDFIHF